MTEQKYLVFTFTMGGTLIVGDRTRIQWVLALENENAVLVTGDFRFMMMYLNWAQSKGIPVLRSKHDIHRRDHDQ